MNWKNRLTNYNFWVSMVSAVLLILQALKIKLDFIYVNEVSTAVLGLLVVLGIINDPTKSAKSSQTKEGPTEQTSENFSENAKNEAENAKNMENLSENAKNEQENSKNEEAQPIPTDNRDENSVDDLQSDENPIPQKLEAQTFNIVN